MLRVVGCFLEYDGKFVLLHRHAHKTDGNTWGLPAGKVEPGETDKAAILRELWEETGYQALETELCYIREDIYRFDHGLVTFVVFKIVINQPCVVKIEKSAHQAYRWISPKEAYAMPNLIYGLHTVLERVGYV